jgi:CheY-like chemotaxis protein
LRESDFRHDSTLFDTFHRDAILPYNEKRVYKGFTSRTWRPWGQIRENDYMARTVLIVEDSDTTADTLEVALLSLPDVSVAHAPSGRKAWQLIQDERVSAIITDLHMPHMDGFELIERIRAAARLDNVAIIVVSGDSDPETPERVRRLGADAYFAKPYSPAAVRDTLERLLHENSPPSP